MTRDELIDIIDGLQRELRQVRNELVKMQDELDWTRHKLVEAQERNRKLDWALTKTVEELR